MSNAMILAARYLAAAMVLFFMLSWPCTTAIAQDVHTYCTPSNGQNQCFPTREQAEQLMRQGSFVRSQLVFAYTNTPDANTLVLDYMAQPVAPSSIGAVTYVSGMAMPDSYRCGGSCLSEDDVINGVLKYLNDTSDGCTFTLQGVSGTHDFVGITNFAPVGRPESGAIEFSGRQMTYVEQCSGQSSQNTVGLAKGQSFICPPDYEGRATDAPHVMEIYASGKWCEAYDNNYGSITTSLLQVDSCAANPYPCYPATGDKARMEPDFEFSGVTFTRYYHSLGQAVMQPAFANGWTHTFSERLIVNFPTPTYIDEQGRYELFQRTSDTSIYQFVSSISGDARLTYDSNTRQSTLVTDDGIIRIFDGDGDLLERDDPARGTRITFAYDGSTLIQATDQLGRSLQFNYQDNQLRNITLPDGSQVSYTRDSNFNLVKVTYADGSAKTYSYNESTLSSSGAVSELTGITGEDGQRYASFGYDNRGRVVLSQLNGADSTSLNYVTDDNVQVTTATGETVTYNVDPSQPYRRLTKVAGAANTITRNYSNSLLYQVTNAGAVTRYGYNDTYLAGITQAAGTPNQRVINLSRDADYQLTSQQLSAQPAGGSQVPLQKETWTRNARGQALTHTLTDPATGATRTVTYTYCEQADINAGSCPVLGLITSVKGPRTDINQTAQYAYYPTTDESGCGQAAGPCHHAGDLYQTINPLGHVRTILVYDMQGRPTRERDANGVLHDYTYHPRGWLQTSIVRANADGTPSAQDTVIRIDYSPSGDVVRVMDADGIAINYTYNAAHRLTDIVDALSNRIHVTMDAAGNPVKEDTLDASGQLRRTLSRSFNSLGQLVALKDGNGQAVFSAAFTDSYDAAGHLVHYSDAIGIQTRLAYDGLDRLISEVHNADGADQATQNTTTTYGFDALDRLTKIIDPSNLITTYQFDGFSNPIDTSSPDSGSIKLSFDAAGNPLTRTDAKGVVATYTYDALNRPVTLSYPDSRSYLKIGEAA